MVTSQNEKYHFSSKTQRVINLPIKNYIKIFTKNFLIFPLKFTGINSNDTSFEEALNNLDPDERRMINPYLTLMKNGLHSKENTKVYVIDGYEKPFFKLKWLWEKLTQQQKRKNNFTTLSSLRNMLIKYPALFKMIGNHVQRMDHLKKFPCEKGISIGKKHALKKYDQFALNTSCFL